MREIEKKSILWRMALFAGMVTIFFCLLIAATVPKYTKPSTPEELAAVELSTEYICLAASNVETYPGQLYTGADFAAGRVSAGDPDAKFETCRVVLPLTPGVTCGITGQTSTYAQRVVQSRPWCISKALSCPAAGHHPDEPGAESLRRSCHRHAAGHGHLLSGDVRVCACQSGEAVVFPLLPVRSH